MSKIKNTAEKILGRKLDPSEGLGIDAIVSAEGKLETSLPNDLKDFYLQVGKIPLFTDGFEFFAQPKQIYIKSNKLVFLEENQAMLSWAVDLEDADKEKNIKVYQSPNIGESENKVVWYPETLRLTEFLEMIMYYQAASGDTDLQKKTKGGYPYGFVSYKSDVKENELWESFEKDLSDNWEKVVDNNGLMIYYSADALLLYYTVQDLDTDVDDLIYINTRKENTLSDFRDKYGFEDVN